jgi:hypothetical protein
MSVATRLFEFRPAMDQWVRDCRFQLPVGTQLDGNESAAPKPGALLIPLRNAAIEKRVKNIIIFSAAWKVNKGGAPILGFFNRSTRSAKHH